MYKILKNIIEMDDYSVQKLSKSQPPTPFQWNTVEGTELNVDDCVGGKGKIGVKGNTYQKQLSGKNLFDYTNETNYINSGNSSLSKIENGIRITTNSSGINRFASINLGEIESFKGKEFAVSYNANASASNTSGFRIYYLNESKQLTDMVTSFQDSGGTFTVPSNPPETAKYIALVLYANVNGTVVSGNYIDYTNIQVEQGSTATDFEEYCGGQASPNPKYSQEVKTVTGNNVIKHLGKNLFDYSATLVSSGSGLTNSIDNEGYIVTNGQATVNLAYICRPQNITEILKDGKTYTLWAEKYKQSDEVTYPRAYIQIRRTKTDGTQNTVFSSTNKIAFTVDKSTYSKYEINVQTGNEKYNYDNYKNRFMLLEGDYTNKEVTYEKYREEEYRLDLWKENELDKNNVNKLNAYIDSSNKIKFSEATRTLYVECKNNTLYKISKAKSARFRAMYTTDTPAINRVGNGYIVNDAGEEIIIKTGNNAKYLCVFYYRANQDTLTEQEILESIQIQEAIELCKIGDYSDILFKNVSGDENYNASLENDTYYKLKKVGKYAFDGTENISLQNNGNRIYIGYANNSNKFDKPIKPSSSTDLSHRMLCSKLKQNTASDTWAGRQGVAYDYNAQSGYEGFDISILQISSLNEYRQAINGIEIYYELAEPKYEQITDTTLISQLEALNKAKWFKGVNHIWTETDNLEPNLKGTYRQAINE